jgi:plastocyanin
MAITTLRALGCSLVLGLAAAGCGSSSSSPSGGASDGPVAQTFTITSAGVSPKTVTIATGSRVTFTNNDSKSHNMNSDPHPEHNSCPALNVGILSPGQSRSSQNLTSARTCGMHDHDDPDNALWKLTIVTQ